MMLTLAVVGALALWAVVTVAILALLGVIEIGVE